MSIFNREGANYAAYIESVAYQLEYHIQKFGTLPSWYDALDNTRSITTDKTAIKPYPGFPGIPSYAPSGPEFCASRPNRLYVPEAKDRSRDDKLWILENNFHGSSLRVRRQRKLEKCLPFSETSHRVRGMARSTNQAQQQRHQINLMSKVLDGRSLASPFTLVLDDLSQRATPLIDEIVRRGLSQNLNVIVISFEDSRFHPAISSVRANEDLSGEAILKRIRQKLQQAKQSLVIVDSLYDLVSIKLVDMSALFRLVAAEFSSTIVGVFHQDAISSQDEHNVYSPQPLDLFNYLATTIVTCKSFSHTLAVKAAKERSHAEPAYGLLEGAEGAVQPVDANDHRGIVLEAEFRRKSGRPEIGTYFLRHAQFSDYHDALDGRACGVLKKEFVVLLEQVPIYGSRGATEQGASTANDMEATFSLGLTEKQKQARDGVVLPYFDAQKGEGAGEGGRILYEMGEEDDFDEEEDEI